MIRPKEELIVSIRVDPAFGGDFALVLRRSFFKKTKVLNNKGEWIEVNELDLIKDNQKLKVENNA